MATSSRGKGQLPADKIIERRETSVEISAHVDWAAVFAGAIVATASALLLAGAGAALGLSFRPSAENASTFGLAAAGWLALVTLYAAGLGGYISGRLRSADDMAPPDEIAFRDGVNGLVVWALGVVLSVILAASAITGAVSTLAQTGGAAVQAVATAAGSASSSLPASADYFIDRAFRPTDPAAPAPQNTGADAREEVTRILAVSVARGSVSNEDKQYISRLVGARTGLGEAEARQRIDALVADAEAAAVKAADAAKETADKARQVGALFGVMNAIITLLAGVFAWYAAQIGGSHRDDAH